VRSVVLVVALALAGGCTQDGLEEPSPPDELDHPFFRCRVESVLVRDCGFLRCHGSAQRPFRVYAPNALRNDVPRDRRAQPLTADEQDANYASALGFAGTDGKAALLLLKPLDEKAGGYYHRAATFYDRGNVFASSDDEGYATIAAWIAGATEAADCVPAEAGR